MKILTHWLRSYLPALNVDDAELAEDLTLRGIAVEGIFELDDAGGDSAGALFDMDITTNRVDAMNHYGIAREIAAIYDLPLHPLDTRLPEPVAAEPFPVRVEAPERCGRFTAQVIRGVTIAASGGTVGDYFTQLGQKQISNAVDVTNYVLLGMGQPTHAFDLDKIEGGIVVRLARAGEQIRLLDGTTRTLAADDLVVADERKPLALAGIMGGYDSMITAETRNILVEAAWFEPRGIRLSSRRHLLHTDASHRFERGADLAAAPIANALVTRHILAACGGTLHGGMSDFVSAAAEAETTKRAPVELAVGEVVRHLGTTLAPEGITAALVERYLGALGCRLTPLDADRYKVALPSWRLDLAREIDLIEEIARVYGYNRFANTLPTPGVVLAHPQARAMQAVRARLLALGFTEALSSTFASAADCVLFAPAAAAVALENPLSDEAANLRPTLLAGMATMLAHNLNRDVASARLFEIGAIFTGSTEAVAERESLTLGLAGPAAATRLYGAEDAPFYELKGALESLLSLFAAGEVLLKPCTGAAFEAGRAATLTLDGTPLAHFGQLGAAEAERRKLRGAVYLAELDLHALLGRPLRQVTAQELSRYQAVERDFSFSFPDPTAWATIAAAIHALALPELTALQAVEVFRDPKRLPEHFSLLLRTTFQAADRTLREEDLATSSAAIVRALEALGATLRSQ